MANILLVDDLAFVKVVEKDILEKGGHKVVGDASNGAIAVQLYNELQPDLVIMDITMPEVNGLEALDAILKINASAKIIMCSALGQQSLIVEAIERGAKDFIVKPFKPERLISAIEKALAS